MYEVAIGRYLPHALNTTRDKQRWLRAFGRSASRDADGIAMAWEGAGCG